MSAELIRAVCSAASVELAGAEPPPDIQWMPPGKHSVVATVKGVPKPLTVVADSDLAARANAALVHFRGLAQAGQGDLPWIDLNHNGAEAAGHPDEIYWGGDDPVAGGIRMKLRWTSAGRDAVMGRTYRRFSPQFLVAKDGSFGGFTTNMGGLVNEAAFTEIAPIWCAQGAPQTTDTTMEQKLDQLIGMLSKLLEKIDAAEMRKPDAAACGMSPDAARAAVAAAAKDGRLAPANPDLHATWEKVCCSSPEGAKALEALPKAGVPSPVIPPGGETRQTCDQAQARRAALEEYRISHPGATRADAFNALQRARPELFA